MDRLRALEMFVKVVETGSFTRAADALATSPAGVTRHIADLEARLGTRLLQRSSRRLALTESGAEYFERAKQVLEDLAEADALASAETRRPAGLLRINVPVVFGTRVLAPLWPRFRALHPEIRLDITLSDRFVDLVEEGVDAAVRVARLPSSNLIARRLATVRPLVCASPAYLARHGTPAVPADLAHHQCLGYRYASTKDEWEFTTADGATQRIGVRCDFHSNNGEVLCEAALAGAGIAVLPSFIAAQPILRGELVLLLPDTPMPELAAHVVYPSRRHLSAKVRALVEFLAAAIGDPPPWDAELCAARRKTGRRAAAEPVRRPPAALAASTPPASRRRAPRRA